MALSYLQELRYVFGRGIRETGQALERAGLRLEEDQSYKTFCRFFIEQISGE